ncbi:MAG: hypothetical protein CBE00_05575 [Planctomycetaceae bacterium TMED240]|nr:hypothetical protein [Rhodopirellula sp.]OUX07216.1 MAG: hypothetical protein CBE00_05575 [Planctomycetaceae bacterium TMED240]
MKLLQFICIRTVGKPLIEGIEVEWKSQVMIERCQQIKGFLVRYPGITQDVLFSMAGSSCYGDRLESGKVQGRCR